MNKQYSVSVIIPVYNECDNVGPLCQEIINAMANQFQAFEVIFVDDGSTDGTVEKLNAMSQQIDEVVAVLHAGNYGQSAALISGARRAKYDWMVTLDGDGQNDPADIPCLFAALEGKFNTVVFGNRKKRDDNGLRKLSSRVGNGIRQGLLKDDCPDTGCSLKLFPREAFLQLPHFNHLHRYLPALFKRAGYKIVNVAVSHRPRLHGVSKYGVMNRLFVGIHDLIGVRWLMKRPCLVEIKHE